MSEEWRPNSSSLAGIDKKGHLCSGVSLYPDLSREEWSRVSTRKGEKGRPVQYVP